MRLYGKISPQFWIGTTGRQLRGNPEAQLVALYLMTSPHANMIGVYHCPIAYIAHETGLPFEGASKGLRSLIEAGFCTYDQESEYVFVHEFAVHQIGDHLDPKDKRRQGVINELVKVPESQGRRGFLDRYAVPFNLPAIDTEPALQPSPSEAPSKPHRSQKQKQKQKQNKKGEENSLSCKQDAIKVLDYLNEKTGRKYQDVPVNLNLIAARLTQGATVAECRGVIDAKVKEWSGDEKMVRFLRPATLFAEKNFAQYVGQLDGISPEVKEKTVGGVAYT